MTNKVKTEIDSRMNEDSVNTLFKGCARCGTDLNDKNKIRVHIEPYVTEKRSSLIPEKNLHYGTHWDIVLDEECLEPFLDEFSEFMGEYNSTAGSSYNFFGSASNRERSR